MGARRRGGRVARARVGPGTVEEEHEWPIEITASTGMVPAPGGELVEPLVRGSLPMAGRSSRRMRVDVTFERRGRRRLEPARLVIADPLGLVERQVEAGAGQEVLVLPRIEPVIAAGGGAGAAADAVVGAPAGRGGGGGRARVAAALPRGSARVAHPLADRRARRHADGTAAARGLGLAAAGGARPDPPGGRGRARHGRSRRRVALPSISRARAAARCSCPVTGGRWTSAPTSEAGRRCTFVSPWSSPARAPRAARLESRRGAIFWVTARAGPAACARTAERRALPRQPGGVARRRRVHGRRLRGGCARPRAAEGGMRAPRTLALELATFAALAWYTRRALDERAGRRTTRTRASSPAS